MSKWLPLIVLMLSTSVFAQDPVPPPPGNTVADLVKLVQQLRANGDNGEGFLRTYTEAQLAIALGNQVVNNNQLMQSHADHRATINEASSSNVQNLTEARNTHVKASNVAQSAITLKGTDEILRLKALRLKETQIIDIAVLNNLQTGLQTVETGLGQLQTAVEALRANSSANPVNQPTVPRANPTSPPANQGASVVVPDPNQITQESMARLADALNKIRVENPAAYTAMKELMVAKVPNPAE